MRPWRPSVETGTVTTVALLVDRLTGFVLAAAWCAACSDGFTSSSKRPTTTPEDGTGASAGDVSGSGASGGVGGGRAPSNGKLGGGMSLPSAGTSTGGSGASTGGSTAASGGADPSTGGSAAATGGTEPATGGAGFSTGGTGPSAGGSSNSGGSENGGSTSSGATGGDGSPPGMGGSASQAGSGTGGTLAPATGGSSAGGSGGSSMTAGAPNSGGSAPIGGCDNQLLANADFEAGPSPSWGEQSKWPGIEIIVRQDNADLLAEGVSPYAGSYLAWLGGIPDNEWDHYLVILTQEVTLPSTAATLTLSGRRHVTSVDDPSDAFDVAYLELQTEAGDLAWQAQAWTNQDTTSGWVPFEASTDVDPQYRGKKLTFVAYSNTDPGGQTSFFLDDLRLEAGCGR